MTATELCQHIHELPDEAIDRVAHLLSRRLAVRVAEWMTHTQATKPRLPAIESWRGGKGSPEQLALREAGAIPAATISRTAYRDHHGIEDRGMEESNAERSANKRDMMRGQR